MLSYTSGENENHALWTDLTSYDSDGKGNEDRVFSLQANV